MWGLSNDAGEVAGISYGINSLSIASKFGGTSKICSALFICPSVPFA
jgi:hypothetical protein